MERALKLDEWSEESLIRAYQSGTREAFVEIYRRWGTKVLGYLQRRGLSRAEAEDVTQEVFTKLHRNRHEIDPLLPISPWVFAIARNALVDHQRKKRREEVLGAGFDVQKEVSKVFSVDVEELVQDLPDHLKEVIIWRYVDDLSFGEIARRLQGSEPNARQIVSRAVRRLRDALNRRKK